MADLLHELVFESAERSPTNLALFHKGNEYQYHELADYIERLAYGLAELHIARRARIAVYLPKQTETVVSFFGVACAGGIFVPVNPALKADQVAHILGDCDVEVLITSRSRLDAIGSSISSLKHVRHVVLVGDDANAADETNWTDLVAHKGRTAGQVIDRDVASILYTSGSTGKPKGVVLSHQNMVAGAKSVATYLLNSENDRLLAVLPFSFDYGFSQLSTAFLKGASVFPLDYLLPKDVISAVEKHQITGLAGVPPLWAQLSRLEWDDAGATIRYFTNSGGAMPEPLLRRLRELMPNAAPFLMYGLTEAFRSTFLPPDQVDHRPTSIGKAIPNAEVMVVRPDGTPCEPDEIGELVHRGALVSLGYWNDPEKTNSRFRGLLPKDGEVFPELAVWSGDKATVDADGFIYFVGRDDEMIKSSGYRISPDEVEHMLYDLEFVLEAVVFGVPDEELGQAVAVVAVASGEDENPTQALLGACRRNLPAYMIPKHIEWLSDLPRNANGKINRPLVRQNLIEKLDV
ncbi:MAG: acyl-CoA ligase (AMP-forming), exosortase A system-associated [Pseudomonadota bacterium]